MIAVDGIILIVSCQKHQTTRLRENNLEENYENWKVIKVIGDLFLDCDYKLEGNLMTIKCEDSYLHLLKKMVLSLKYIYEIFDIKEGILRCGDDLIFNENNLVTFLKSSKKNKINDNEYIDIDYMGVYIDIGSSYYPNKPINDDFFVNYYNCHPEDFDNPQHNLKGVDIAKYNMRPYVKNYIAGPLIYFSNKSCKILINHMSNIDYNIYHYDDKTESYPYHLEDTAISYILLLNNIKLISAKYWYCDIGVDPQMYIALHTNNYKYT